MKKEKESESPLVVKLLPEQKNTLKRIRALLKANKIKNASDSKWVEKALADLQHNGILHESTILWFSALVNRAGEEFKPENKEEVVFQNSQK